MKIRTSLVVACFLLSVVPLGVIVVYSYYSSRHALQKASHAEATRMARQMDRRLATLRNDLQERLAEVSALPEPSQGNVLMTMGDAASLVDSIEIQPPHPGAAPTPAPKPMVIRIPPIHMPRFVMSADQRNMLKQISKLGTRMHAQNLTDEQRDELQKQMEEAQKAFSSSMQDAQTQYSKALENVVQQQEKQHDEQMRIVEQQREEAEKQREAAQDAAERAQDQQQDKQEQAADAAEEKKDNSNDNSDDADEDDQQRVHVGNLQANVSTKRIVRRILNRSADDDEIREEVPFAIDREGNVYTRTDSELKTLEGAGIPQRITEGKPLTNVPNWVVVSQRDPESGLQVGVARPFGEDLEELRRTAAKNFGYGIALIFVALIGIVPVANHISGDIELVTRGAERIAQGDLTTRLPVHSKNEVGQLATAFNLMAEDLSLQQQLIVEQERAAIEYERKSAELEEARRFQLSMLPKEVPKLDAFDIAVFTHTATEVGGDYYDFDVDGGDVAITIGDATGHGARAGTMVAVIKALFAGYSSEQPPSTFLRDATEKIRRMDLGRMAMALLVARFRGRDVTIASAGMPPTYVHRRATGAVEEVSRGATPLGTLGDDYRDACLELHTGDTMLFMSDGFPELMNEDGQQLGYSAAIEAFAAAAKAENANAVIASLQHVVHNWHGDQPPNDDVTFVVVRVRESGRSFSA